MWGKVLCRDVKPRSSLGETEHKMVKFKIMRKGSKGSNRNTNLDFRKADFDWFSGTCLEKFLGFWREDRSRRVLSVQKDWVRENLNRLGVQYMETHRMHFKVLRDLASITVWKLRVIWGYSWGQRERKHHYSLPEEQENWLQLSSWEDYGTPNPGDHFWVKVRTRRWLAVASMALQSRKHTWQKS